MPAKRPGCEKPGRDRGAGVSKSAAAPLVRPAVLGYPPALPSGEGTPFVALPNGTGGEANKHGRTVIVEVQVRDNNVDQALRALKKKMQREGLYREMRMRRHYEKPSERRAREKAEAIRRYRKLMRKRAERDEV